MRVIKWYLVFKAIPSIGPRLTPIWTPWAWVPYIPIPMRFDQFLLSFIFLSWWLDICYLRGHGLSLPAQEDANMGAGSELLLWQQFFALGGNKVFPNSDCLSVCPHSLTFHLLRTYDQMMFIKQMMNQADAGKHLWWVGSSDQNRWPQH